MAGVTVEASSTHMSNLLLALLGTLGVRQDAFGDSTLMLAV